MNSSAFLLYYTKVCTILKYMDMKQDYMDMKREHMDMKQACTIVGGAPIQNYERIRKLISNDDFFIFCDSGLLHAAHLLSRIDLVVGDFDSFPEERLPHIIQHEISEFPRMKSDRYPAENDCHLPSTEIMRLPREKDDTDTAFAVKYAIGQGFREFTLIGVYGGAADHSLANLGLMKYIKKNGGNAILLDDYSVMEVIEGEDNRITNEYRYFSLLPIYGRAESVTIRNAKYEMKDTDISLENPFTVSNETLDGDTVISIKKGMLLVIKSDRH